MLTANLIGLLIQSVDAGRGLWSNVRVQLLNSDDHGAPSNRRQNDFRKALIDTLRIDLPIHNTRRLLRQDLVISGEDLKAGEHLFIVLAAANRDPGHFHHPNRYEEDRFNNESHLTFGASAHACLVKPFMVNLTTDVFTRLFYRYPNIELTQDRIEYEPRVNARLPVERHLHLSSNVK